MIILISILAGGLSPAALDSRPRLPLLGTPYVSYDKRCIYWLGEVRLSAEQFRDQLKLLSSGGRKITIYHSLQTPGVCVARARKLARNAGFHDVDTVVEDVIASRNEPSTLPSLGFYA